MGEPDSAAQTPPEPEEPAVPGPEARPDEPGVQVEAQPEEPVEAEAEPEEPDGPTPESGPESAGSASDPAPGEPEPAANPEEPAPDAKPDEPEAEQPEAKPEVPGRDRRRWRIRRRNRRPKPPGRDPWWAKALVAAGVVLVLLAGGLIGAKTVIEYRIENAVHHETLLAPEARSTNEEQRETVTGPLNFLLIGSDARDDGSDGGERSDTIIVLHVSEPLDSAYLVSIPRDLRVQIPAFEETGFSGLRGKVNGAFQYGGGDAGGVQLLSQTLSDLMGIQFDGAAVVDFSGFSDVVDLLGGVYLCVDVRTESIHIGFDEDGNYLAPRYGPEGAYRNSASTPMVYEVGCREFEGWEALDYVRQRKTLPNGDYDRQRHQQQFLNAVLSEAKSQGLMTDPLLLDELIQAVGDSITIDLNNLDLTDLALSLSGLDTSSLYGITVPSETQTINAISYVVALDEAETLSTALTEDTMADWVAGHEEWVNTL